MAAPLPTIGGEVDVVDVTKKFGSVTALDSVSLHVPRGSVVCLLGPSGSGKSTLLRCINRLEVPNSGMVFIDGQPVGFRRVGQNFMELGNKAAARQRSATGMVFQHFNLFNHRTVLENVMEGPIAVKRMPRAEARARAIGLLERVGLADKLSAYPSQLSGGQQQRVAIARSLASQPSTILFDEPTSALDPELVGEVLEVMRDLAQQGFTMIVVTHEIGFAAGVADTVVYMEKGKIVESGSAEQVIHDPLDARTRKFMSHVR